MKTLLAFVPYYATVEIEELHKYRYYEDAIYIYYDETTIGSDMTVEKLKATALDILEIKLKAKGNIIELVIDTDSIDIIDK